MIRKTAVTGAFALILCASHAKADIVDASVDEARACIYTVLSTKIQVGIRDRKLMINQAMSTCEAGLLAHLLPFSPTLNKARIRSILVDEANRQIDALVSNAGRR